MDQKVHLLLPVVGVLALLVISGCVTPRQTGPYDPPSESHRDPRQAQELTLKAADSMEKNEAGAEELLRAALTADLFHGPAHNNLGVLHLKRGELYEAASEFEWARKLMPGHPDPRLNLALTLERAGRIDEAIAACDSALEVYPGHVVATEALARLQLRNNRTDGRTRDLLQAIIMRGTTERWKTWASEQLLRVDSLP